MSKIGDLALSLPALLDAVHPYIPESSIVTLFKINPLPPSEIVCVLEDLIGMSFFDHVYVGVLIPEATQTILMGVWVRVFNVLPITMETGFLS